MSSGTTSSGTFNEINSDFQALSPVLQNSIKKVIEKEHFTQYDVTVKKLNTRGDNLTGKLYDINIKSKIPTCKKDINIFAKEKIIFKKLTIVNIEQLYANEELVYKHLSKIITHLQETANVPPKERYKIAEAYDETSNDAIILENLRHKGFKTYSKDEPVPLKFFELGVQQLAKFHGISFVIEKEMPEYFKKNYAVLENAYKFDESMNSILRNICKYISGLYDDDETKIKIEKFVPVLLEKLPKYQNDKTNICTLSHGDYKKNNIMVRLIDGEPIEVIAIDYQLIDYGCPIRDLLYFIFTGTDQEFRRKHLNNLKELYFETLSRFLNYFNIDVETVYPREQFQKIYTEWLEYGIMLTLTTIYGMIALESGQDLVNQNLADISFCPDKKYDYILRGLVDDFVEWGYL